MKKNTSNKMNLARKTQVAIAVAMLTGPILAVPEIVYAAETVHLYLKANAADIKGSEKYTIVGLQDAHTVYKSAGGQFFYLNKQGDMQFLTEGIFKFFRPNPKGDGTTEEESHDHKHPGDISILGVDANGHTINQNERGEKFFVNTGSGDFTFVDGKNLTPFHAPAPDSNPANLTIRKAGDKPVEYLNVGKAPVTPGTATPLAWSWGMSQQGTLAWNWGGTQSETRSKENPHLPKAGDTVLFEGKQGVVQLQNGSPVINWGDGTTSSGSKGGAGKALSSFFDVFTERSVGKGGNANAGGITHEDTWDANKSLPVPDSGPPSKHHYIGTVTLLKGMAPNPKDGQSSGPANLSLNFAKIEVEYHETENKAGSGNYKAGSKLGTDGSFHFNLPEGKYKLQLPGQPEQSVIVGSDGKFGGKVMEGSDGKMLIFDRWGNLIFEAAPKGTGSDIPGGRVVDGANSALGSVSTTKGRILPPTLSEGDPNSPGVALRESPGKQSLGTMQTGGGGGAGKVNIQDLAIIHHEGDSGEVGKSGIAGPTVPPPKIGNDKPIKADVGPVGFGRGGPASPGMGPDFNGMGGGPNPGMMGPPGGGPAMSPVMSPMGPGPMSPGGGAMSGPGMGGMKP